MSSRTVAWITLSLVATAAGCRMCDSPYDYCKPTYTGSCGDDCSPIARAGSILSGHVAPVPDDGYLDEQVPYDETASGVATSVTEEKPEEAPQDVPEDVPQDVPQVVQENPPSQSQGWTAAKPLETVRQ